MRMIAFYGLVAVLIALTAFGLGQLVPGLGMPFAIAASIGWTAYTASRQRRRHRCG